MGIARSHWDGDDTKDFAQHTPHKYYYKYAAGCDRDLFKDICQFTWNVSLK
jgi:hypothetical protein